MTGSARTVAPVATVLIPAFDEEDHIAGAIESVLAQGRDDVAILVVDDHSNDATVSIASAYPGVTVIANEGRGLPDGLNTGLRRAESEIVVCLDADDRHLPGALDTLVEGLIERPDAAIVIGGARFVDESGRSVAQQSVPPSADHLRLVAMAFNPIVQSAVAFRRSAIIELGGYRADAEGIVGALDFDLWSRALAAEVELVGLPADVVVFALRTSSLSARGRPDQITRADRIRSDNEVRWSDDLLRVGRLRALLGELPFDRRRAGAFDVVVLAIMRLMARSARRGRIALVGRLATVMLVIGPHRSGWAAARNAVGMARRRRARGWSAWRRRG